MFEDIFNNYSSALTGEPIQKSTVKPVDLTTTTKPAEEKDPKEKPKEQEGQQPQAPETVTSDKNLKENICPSGSYQDMRSLVEKMRGK
jgi:hypothetical protein